MHLTQAAISFQVRNLERSLAVKLFLRRHRQLELTAEGVVLFNAVQSAFETLSSQKQVITGNKSGNSVSISAPVSFCSKWLIPNLKSRTGAFAKIKLLIDANDDQVEMKSGEFDLAIRYAAKQPVNSNSEVLIRDTVFPVCSPQYLASVGGNISAASLADMTLLWDKMADYSWGDWLRNAGLTQNKPGHDIHFSHTANAIDAAIAGQGLAIGRPALVADDLKNNRLICPLGDVAASDYCYYILRSQNPRRNRNVEAVVSWLKDMAAATDYPKP